MTRAEYIIDDDFLDDETKMSAESQGFLWELIRCKDCMFYQTDKGGWCLDHDDDVLWLDDSYCSRAVRKEK